MNFPDKMTYSESESQSSVIDNILQLLHDYSWIYNFKVTNLLSDNILGTIPAVWRTFLSNLSIESFNEILVHQNTENSSEIPQDVRKFLDLYNSALISFESLISSDREEGVEGDREDDRGVSQKKKHEIKRFADLIGKPGTIDFDARET